MYFFPFYDIALKEVLIGYQCPVSQNYIQHLLWERFEGMHLTVYKTTMHPELFEVRRHLPTELEIRNSNPLSSQKQEATQPHQPA